LKKNLEPWNIQISEYASKIVVKRLKFLQANKDSIVKIHNSLTREETITIKYKETTGWPETETLEEEYKKFFY
jgi:Recombinational DNA repair ATPase (RecF pathway)